jgi:hypothetical protein
MMQHQSKDREEPESSKPQSNHKRKRKGGLEALIIESLSVDRARERRDKGR